jgi:hypothetical protein
VYFFIVRDHFIRSRATASMQLEPLDSDEAQLLMSEFAFSSFQPKK